MQQERSLAGTTDNASPGTDFPRLFEAMPHPYLILKANETFTITAVNDYYLSATGTVRSALVGHGLFEIFPDNPDDTSGSGVSDLRTSLDRVKRERVQDIMGVQKYDIPRRDDSGGFDVKYWSPVNTPVFDAEGRVAQIIHHVEDITEFVLSRERASQENSEKVEKVRAQADRMEAEVMRRANEVKEANRQIKAAMEELEKREAELGRLNERLKDLDRAKTEFFSNISHEFRTPLTLLLGPVEEVIAKPASEVTPEVRAALEVAHRNALRLLRLVNNLLDFSRIEAGHAKAHAEPTDLAALTATLASNFDSACKSAELYLKVDCPPLPQPVYVDRSMWEKIVLNLISNAFKFTFQGGLSIQLRPRDGNAELVIQDTGIGIPQPELPRLFDRFHRVAGAQGRSYEGSGIGLALVKELVLLHNGDIEVASTETQGTVFTIRLPFGTAHLPKEFLAEVKPQDQKASTQVHADAYLVERPQGLTDAATPEADQKEGIAKGTVFVADDNPDMRSYISGLLERAGYEVLSLTNGEEVLTACRARVPDLILSDVMMPVMDGFALLNRLRKDERTASIPTVLLSARAGEEARIEGLDAGADDYLVKPFAARELVARVESTIRLAHVRQEAAEREKEIMADANRRLDEAFSRLREIDRLKSMFIASMSHELRTPLNSIIGFSKVLLNEWAGSLNDEQRDNLAIISRAGKHLLGLINDVIDVSKIEAGKMEVRLEEFDLADVQREMFEMMGKEAQQRGLSLNMQVPSRKMRADRQRLSQCLLNLISNSLKYTEQGSIRLRALPADNSGNNGKGHLHIIVEDTGIGISSEDAKNLFSPFIRFNSPLYTKEKGTGLGLYLTKKLATQVLQGDVLYEPRPEGGSRFILVIPETMDGASVATGGNGPGNS